MDMGILAPTSIRLFVDAHRLLVPNTPSFIRVFRLPHYPHSATGTCIVCPINEMLSKADFFRRTIQFVGISAFHTRISDPLIGGTYMTV
jgi:hypothetical protein